MLMKDSEYILFLAVKYTVEHSLGPMSVQVRWYLKDILPELSYGALLSIHDCIWEELKKEIDEYGDTIYPEWLELVKQMEALPVGCQMVSTATNEDIKYCTGD